MYRPGTLAVHELADVAGMGGPTYKQGHIAQGREGGTYSGWVGGSPGRLGGSLSPVLHPFGRLGDSLFTSFTPFWEAGKLSFHHFSHLLGGWKALCAEGRTLAQQ